MGNKIGAASPAGGPKDVAAAELPAAGTHEGTQQIKVWGFEAGKDGVVTRPVDVRSAGTGKTVDNAKCYVLLSIAHSDFPGGVRSRTMDDIATQARQNMTPRGLMVDVGAGTAGPYTYQLYVWNGRSADVAVKACALSHAFSTAQTLRQRGNLVQKLFQSTAQTIEGRGAPAGQPISGNTLLEKVLKPRGPAKLGRFAEAVSGRPESRVPGRSKLPAFSAVVAEPRTAWSPEASAVKRTGEAAAVEVPEAPKAPRLDPSAPSAKAKVPAVPSLALKAKESQGAPAVAATPRVGGPAGVPALGKPGVPGLALGGQKPALAAPPRAAPDARGAEQRPIGLDLEQITLGRSEEELIQSYDPDCDENNHHLPDHLRKELALKQYRAICSQITPNLYLSGFGVAHDRSVLKDRGVTHIVNTAACVCENMFPDEFEYLTYHLKDTKSENISAVFHRTLEWIEAAIVGGGKVLVHCREGVSRSSTIVIAYLIWKQRLPFEQAYEQVRSLRMISNPNAGFTCQLILFGKRLGTSDTPASDGKESVELARVAPHHPNKPFLLLQPEELSSTVALDPRFAYVAQRGVQLLLLVGADVPNREDVARCVNETRACYERVERRAYAKLRFAENPSAFWAFLEAPPVPLRPLSKFDADFELAVQSAALQSPGESPSSSNSRPVLGYGGTDPQLYMYPELSEPLEMFDSDDLDESRVFVLFVPETTTAHVWVGTQSGGAGDLAAIGRDLLSRLGQAGGAVAIEQEGDESDAFWDAFDRG